MYYLTTKEFGMVFGLVGFSGGVPLIKSDQEKDQWIKASSEAEVKQLKAQLKYSRTKRTFTVSKA